MTAVMAPAHYYLWRRLVRDAGLPIVWRRTLTALIVVLLVSIPAMMFLARFIPRETIGSYAFVTFLWLGTFSTFFVLTSLVDISRLVVGRVKRGKADAAPVDPERRTALNRIFAGGVAFGGTAMVGSGVAVVASGFEVIKLEVTLDKLPKQFDGFRIAQMSDVHVGSTIGGDFVRKIVETCNELSPDLVAITGDLVDGSVANLRPHTQPLADLQATHGAYFVTGNHEYYSGADDWVREMARLQIPTLRNDAIRLEKEGASLLLAGVTDHRAAEFGDAPDLAHALRSRRNGEEVVLLAHQPRELSEAVKHDVGLQISGHTHGGQFWPWNWVVHLIQPVVAGLARFGRTQIYVNSGTGYWGPPMRVGTRSEITLITLRARA